MINTLAVFTMQLRSVSETFVRRHLEDLAPGRTVAVSRMVGLANEEHFPVFFEERWALRLPVRLAIRAGIKRRRLLEASIERFLRRHQADVVLGEYLDQFSDFVPLLDRMGLRYVVQGHGMDLSSSLRLPQMIERYQVYQSAAAILTRCDFHRRRLIEIGLPADKIHVNPGGVDIPSALPVRGTMASTRFLAVGRMVPQKAPIMLLEAFRLAALVNSDITLDYVGGGQLFPAVQQFVKACGLERRVRLHGIATEDEKMRLLRECGVFVQHSAVDPEMGNEEGLPAAIQEAMANGLAVVSTRHSGIPEAVLEGETGLLVDEGNVKAMAEAFLEVPSIAVALGNAGYLRAVANYSWDQEKARLDHWLSAP